MPDDGVDRISDKPHVNREGHDYRAGWVEALKTLGNRLMVEGVRAKKNQVAGLEMSSKIVQEMYEAMLDKMRGPK